MDIQDLEAVTDLDVVVRQLSEARHRLKQPRVDLSGRINGLTVEDTMHGASSVSIQIIDEEFELFDSGYFDVRDDGKLDALEINYPEGTDNWWRITQCNPNANGIIEAVFMEAVAVYLMSHKGPVKTSRGKKTRAEFFKMLCDKVKKRGGISFHSRELHKTQPKEREKVVKKKSDKDARTDKDGGVHTSDKLKINGKEASLEQCSQINRAMRAIPSDAPERAVIAMLTAGVGESQWLPNKGGGTGNKYIGVFQGQAKYGFTPDSTEEMANAFMKGGKGFGGGGAIAQVNAHPDKAIGIVIGDVEVSYPNKFLPNAEAARRYYEGEGGSHLKEAEAILEAYGGGFGGGGTTYKKQFNFQIGTEQDPHETYWDGMVRLAEDVNWAWFIDGNDAYFDSELTLIQQAPAAFIHRDDPAVVDWSFEWDERKVCTELRLSLICEPFEFRAGEVFKLTGFGPASTGSTVTHPTKQKPKRPGYWLISESTRNPASLATDFTLRQPTSPIKEPLAGEGTRDDTGTSGGDIQAIAKHLGSGKNTYTWGGGHGKLEGLSPPLNVDCSGLISLALYRAGMMTGDVGQVSGWFASSWGKPGKGDDFTVWAHSGHVFMQGGSGNNHWRLDTSHVGPNGEWYHEGRGAWRTTDGFTPRHFSGTPKAKKKRATPKATGASGYSKGGGGRPD